MKKKLLLVAMLALLLCLVCGSALASGSCKHSMTSTVVEEPTCTEDGVYPIYSCAHCDATYGGKVIPAYGHSLVIRLKKDADDPLRAPKEWYCVMCGYTDGVAELH